MKTLTRQILRKNVALALAALMPLAGGCSVFQPSTQRVTIVPSEPGAKVYLNNNPVGTGTTTLELQRNRTYAVSARSGQNMGSASIGRSSAETPAGTRSRPNSAAPMMSDRRRSSGVMRGS